MRGLLPLLGTTILLAAAAFGVTRAVEVQKAGVDEAMLNAAEQSTIPPNQRTASTPTTISMPRLRPDVYYEAITDRPLFSPERRRFVPNQDSTEEIVVIEDLLETPPPLPELALLGTMGSSDNPIALLKAGDEPAEWFAVGDNLGGWSLSSLGPDWAQVTDGNLELRLEMFQ